MSDALERLRQIDLAQLEKEWLQQNGYLAYSNWVTSELLKARARIAELEEKLKQL